MTDDLRRLAEARDVLGELTPEQVEASDTYRALGREIPGDEWPEETTGFALAQFPVVMAALTVAVDRLAALERSFDLSGDIILYHHPDTGWIRLPNLGEEAMKSLRTALRGQEER